MSPTIFRVSNVRLAAATAMTGVVLALAGCGGGDADLAEEAATTLVVPVDCCDARATALSVDIAWGVQAAANLDADTPVLVLADSSEQARDAVALLAAGGQRHIRWRLRGSAR